MSPEPSLCARNVTILLTHYKQIIKERFTISISSQNGSSYVNVADDVFAWQEDYRVSQVQPVQVAKVDDHLLVAEVQLDPQRHYNQRQ